MKQYCENCIVELKHDTKKLGKGSTKWYLCSDCGYREKQTSKSYWENKERLEKIKLKYKQDEQSS